MSEKLNESKTLQLVAPVSYQGGKTRIASKIVDHIYVKDAYYYDLCCGSGAISIELIKRGIPPNHLTMVDKGPWGLFWKSIGDGTFSLAEFRKHIEALPENPKEIGAYLLSLSKNPVGPDQVYVYLLLQAGSFGSKPIWVSNGRWQNNSFRNYWEPTETSSRRSPVNPMMPMPETIYARVKALVDSAYGVIGLQADIRDITPKLGSIVYIDPPYEERTKYGFACDYVDFIEKTNTICYLSEGRQLSNNAVLIASGRKKGGVSGKRLSAPAEEWLNVYNTP